MDARYLRNRRQVQPHDSLMGRYTHHFIEQNERLTLSFCGEAYRKALQVCGTKSGRDTDAHGGWHTVYVVEIEGVYTK